MRLFGSRRKSKGTYRRKTDEQIEKEQTRREKQWARDKLLEKAKDNPELENQYIAKLMGIEIKPPDPVAEKKEEIKSKIVDKALEKISKDPELAEQFVTRQIEEIVGESTGKGTEFYGEPGSILRQAIEELEDVEEFRNKIGGKVKGSALGGLVDSETVKEILKTIQALKTGVIPQERTYVVQINGEPTEVSESQYRQLVQSGQIKPIAALEEAKGLPPEEKVEPIKLEPELPEFISTNLTELAGYLEQEPEDFITQLEYEVQAEIPHSQFLWGFLSNTTYEGIVNLVTPYREHSQVSVYVEKILSEEGKTWLEQVIVLIKEKESAG